jgi:hypothetical protein
MLLGGDRVAARVKKSCEATRRGTGTLGPPGSNLDHYLPECGVTRCAGCGKVGLKCLVEEHGPRCLKCRLRWHNGDGGTRDLADSGLPGEVGVSEGTCADGGEVKFFDIGEDQSYHSYIGDGEGSLRSETAGNDSSFISSLNPAASCFVPLCVEREAGGGGRVIAGYTDSGKLEGSGAVGGKAESAGWLRGSQVSLGTGGSTERQVVTGKTVEMYLEYNGVDDDTSECFRGCDIEVQQNILLMGEDLGDEASVELKARIAGLTGGGGALRGLGEAEVDVALVRQTWVDVVRLTVSSFVAEEEPDLVASIVRLIAEVECGLLNSVGTHPRSVIIDFTDEDFYQLVGGLLCDQTGKVDDEDEVRQRCGRLSRAIWPENKVGCTEVDDQTMNGSGHQCSSLEPGAASARGGVGVAPGALLGGLGVGVVAAAGPVGSVQVEFEAQGEPTDGKLSKGGGEACGSCGGRVATMLRCSACRNTDYCSADCQKRDWMRHKVACGAMKGGGGQAGALGGKAGEKGENPAEVERGAEVEGCFQSGGFEGGQEDTGLEFLRALRAEFLQARIGSVEGYFSRSGTSYKQRAILDQYTKTVREAQDKEAMIQGIAHNWEVWQSRSPGDPIQDLHLRAGPLLVEQREVQSYGFPH